MAFFVGQKVVYIAEGRFTSITKKYPDVVCPKKNHVYTIRELTEYGGILGIRLVEIVNHPHQYNEAFAENAWRREEFRPVVERKTDISIFTKMLMPSKEDA